MSKKLYNLLQKIVVIYVGLVNQAYIFTTFLYINYYRKFILFTISFCSATKRNSEPRKKNTLFICNPLDCSSPDWRTSVPLQYFIPRPLGVEGVT